MERRDARHVKCVDPLVAMTLEPLLRPRNRPSPDILPVDHFSLDRELPDQEKFAKRVCALADERASYSLRQDSLGVL